MDESLQQSTVQGLNEADPAENLTTMAPNVGPPRSAAVDRRDTGYVSLDQPAMSRLATPEEFGRSTRSQASPVSECFSGDNHSSFGRMCAPKNVTFRGVRRRSYDNYSSSSDASDEDLFSEANGVPVATFVAGLAAGPSPATKPRPLERPATGWPAGVALVAGSEPRLFRWRDREAGSGPALRRGDPPLNPPDFDHHGDWADLPGEIDDVVESRRHRHRGESAGGARPRRRSSPSDEATNRENNRHAKHVLPTLKLGTFDGSNCLKTFLAKFKNCSDYHEWTEKGKLCHLRASLDGPAG